MINYAVDYWRILIEAIKQKEGCLTLATEANVTWEPPPVGVVKINTDASLASGEFRGLGAVLRDHLGGLVASACAKMVRNWDAETSEACAARFGMKVAKSLGFNHIILETNATEVAHALNSKTYKLDYASTFVKDCHHLINDFSSVKFMHAKRSYNKVAHELARAALSKDGTNVWVDGGPLEIMALVMLNNDCIRYTN